MSDPAPASVPLATHAGTLDLAGVSIDCWVLSDGRRMLSQRGLYKALGMSSGGGKGGARKIAALVTGIIVKASSGAESGASATWWRAVRNLVLKLQSPTDFVLPDRRTHALGYEATLLAEVCEAVLHARDANALHHRQIHLARYAELLMRAFAAVGIVALVDEATGYQETRERRALAAIFKKFISAGVNAWTRTFPEEFYQEIFRLRGWEYSATGIRKRPGIVAYYTNDLIYLRLAPGILKTLQTLVERYPTGRPKDKLFQRLTLDHGHPALREHLGRVIMLARISPDWNVFMGHMQHVLPRYDANLDLFPEIYIPPPPDETDGGAR
jgi:hypothetical protein